MVTLQIVELRDNFFYFLLIDSTRQEITNSMGTPKDSGWLVQGDLFMFAMFNTMFELRM